MEFNTPGEFAAVSTLLAGKARVNTQNISPSLSFITELNLSFMSKTRSKWTSGHNFIQVYVMYKVPFLKALIKETYFTKR